MKHLNSLVLVLALSGCALFRPSIDATETNIQTQTVYIPVTDLPKAPEVNRNVISDLPYKSLNNSDRTDYAKIARAYYTSLKILETELNIKFDFIEAYNQVIEENQPVDD